MDLILISGKDNKTLNLRIKLGLLIFVVIIIAAIFILFIYNINKLATTDVDQNRLTQLKEENRIVRQEMVKFEKEMLDLNNLIDSLELYDKKIRTYAALTPINEDLRNMGIGGYTKDYNGEKLSTKVREDFDDLSQTLDNLLARVKLQKESFDKILTHLEEKTYLQNHTPSILPVCGWFVRGFGFHKDPFTGEIKMHEGLDIAAPIGTPIIAPADGTVKSVGERRGFGITLEIDHGYGFTTLYGHCQRIKVNKDMKVKRGDIIAYVGNTGKSTGPHLHYEVRISQTAIDPINYIFTTSFLTD